MDITAAAGLRRTDGREAQQLRPPALEDGLLNRADGSARVNAGHTSVIAAVFGPMQGRSRGPGVGQPDCLSIEVVLSGGSGIGNGQATSNGVAAENAATYKSILLDVLHSSVCLAAYPRCSLTVACRVLHNDGSCLAALVNAAAAALMDAGVDMVCMPVGAAFAWRPPSLEPQLPQLLVDPDAAEEAKLANITVVCSAAPDSSQLLAMHAVGCLDDAALPACVEAAEQVARTFAQISRRKNEVR